MEENLNHKAEMILKDNVKNLELISYFNNSNIKTPVYLGVIQRNYAEIKSLITNGLIEDLEPVKSYIFNLDKLENYFYKKFQEKIDNLKTEIWKRKNKKTEIIRLTEEMEPDEGCEDYELKLYECRRSLFQISIKWRQRKKTSTTSLGNCKKILNNIRCINSYYL
jgi:hypothetical protein